MREKEECGDSGGKLVGKCNALQEVKFELEMISYAGCFLKMFHLKRTICLKCDSVQQVFLLQ